MRIIILSAVALLSTFVLFSCKKDNPIPPEEQPQVTLSLEDVNCTEAWIKLNVTNLTFPADVELYRDSNLAESISLSNTDSLLYIDSLLPNQTYSFHTIIHSYNHTITSDPLQVSTMDTTSHNFTWQTWTFGGQAGSCILRDVAIIDENNIWAVGEIHLVDTAGVPDPNVYNLAHWDGNQWELKRVYFPSVCGSINVTSFPASAIAAFDDGEIWISSTGDKIAIFRDTVQTDKFCLPSSVSMSITEIWGTSSDNLYVVGYRGKIAHYLNGTWNKITSGTTTNVNDIWGTNDPISHSSLVLCTVSDRYQLGDHKLLSISGDGTTEYIPWPYTTLYGIWFNSPRKIYIVGGRAYVYKNDSLEIFDVPSNYYLTRVRGNDLNDIYIATEGAEILHYNGMNWTEMTDGVYGSYEGMDVKGNMVAVVGYNIQGGIVGSAVVTLGKHFP